jgi:hypothetical protein
MSTTKGKTPVTRPLPTCAFEEITPDIAKQMLGVNHINRRLIDSGVERLTGVLERGEWMEDSTDAIGLDDDGGVVNGQHRLTSIMESGITVTALVVRGVRPDVIKVIDQGQPRNLSQLLQMSGRYEYASDLASSITNLWKVCNNFEQKLPRGVAPSVPQLLEFFDVHPHLVDSLRSAVDVAKGIKGVSKTWLAPYHYLMSTVDPDAADEFFSKLESGAEIQPGDPVHALREKIIANASSNTAKQESAHVVAAWMVKAWEADRAGRSLTKQTLKYVYSGARAEDFPKVSNITFGPDGAILLEDEAA